MIITILLGIIAILLLVLVLANDRAREVLFSLLYRTGRFALWALALGVVAGLVVWILQHPREIILGAFKGVGILATLVFFYFVYCAFKKY